MISTECGWMPVNILSDSEHAVQTHGTCLQTPNRMTPDSSCRRACFARRSDDPLDHGVERPGSFMQRGFRGLGVPYPESRSGDLGAPRNNWWLCVGKDDSQGIPLR